MSMEEKQNSQTFLDFNQNIFNPSILEKKSADIIRNCYKKNIPLEINGSKIKKQNWQKFSG